jgi:Rad3-related DNA helicase
MFSVELDQAALREAAREARRIGASFARPLDRVADEVREAGAGEIEALLDRLETLLVELGRWLVRAPAGPPQARFEALRGDLSRFLEVGRLATGARSDAFLRRFDPEGPRLHLQCLDPAPLLREAIDALAGLVLFSATLGPAPLRRLELGLPEHSQWLALPNPYPPERRLLLVADDLDLRSRAREANLKRLVATIVELVDARAGHYLVFAPSFLFLGTLADALGAERPDWCVQRQARGMSETEREAFVDALRTPAPGRTRVALAVAGGLFAEGVDLPGEALIGVVVAGLPLPAPDVERRALADYHGAAGRDLAFRAPAVTRVLQAAGRLVRDEADSGIVCIVDARLREQEFRRLFPEDWNPARVRARDAGRAARAFWARQGSAESPEP